MLLTRESRRLLRRIFRTPRSKWRAAWRKGFAYQGETFVPSRQAAPRHAERASAAAPPSSSACRTTTRSATAPRRAAAQPRPSRGPARRHRFAAAHAANPDDFHGRGVRRSRPFLYFTDHHEELGRQVAEGRRREFACFAAFTDPEQARRIPDPQRDSQIRVLDPSYHREQLDRAVRAMFENPASVDRAADARLRRLSAPPRSRRMRCAPPGA